MDTFKINAAQKTLYEKLGYWSDISLLDRWNQTVAVYPNKEFVVDDRGSRYTYKKLDHAASVFASWLTQAGIKRGDVVSFQIPPRAEFVIIMIACLKTGAVLAPLGMCLVDDELTELLNLLKSKIHISAAYHRNTDRAAMLTALRHDTPTIVLLNADEHQLPGFVSFEKIMASSPPLQAAKKLHGNDLALLLCTSGTTQKCRAVMLTHNNIIFSEDGFNRAMGLSEDDIIFMPAPLSHATGFHHGIVSPMLLGGKVVLQETFCCKPAIALMNQEKCTYSMGATPFIYDILKELKNVNIQLPYLRFYLCGGSPVPPEMVRQAYKEYGIRVCEVYGSTESVPHAFVRPEETLTADGRWSGRAMEGVEIRVVDDKRHDVPLGQIGEEVSRGPNVFVGYLDDMASTDSILDDKGWCYSGDLCTMDESGNIKIVGRKKDIIVRGGENLSVNEIDNNLEGCPNVADHTVAGVYDKRLGERIGAYIVPEPGTTGPSLKDMIIYLESKRIPKRYWPERLILVDAIPRTESGKVKKHLLNPPKTSKPEV